MRPPVPLPTSRPFLTFYTPTFRRPKGLTACMRSITRQTAVEHVEQLVIPDHVGYGLVGGLFGRIPWYAEACRGEYVTIIADDDHLAAENVVAKVMAFARSNGNPPVIVVNSIKNGLEYPSCDPADPQLTQVDLGCYILRRDVWLAHCRDYGHRYEGDYDHAVALKAAGWPVAYLDLDFVEGGNSNGRQEEDWH